MKAIRVHKTGGPEVLVQETLARPQPGPGEVLVRIAAAGVNYIDVYFRTGLYPMEVPYTPGVEGAGVIEACGDGVSDLEVGQTVAWAGVPGAYAHYAVVPRERLVAVPRGISPEQAAAAMLQGMTAHYLTRSTFALQQGQTALVHAAAGGVGLLLVQMAHTLGARVIGTTSTEEKAALAREAGCDEVILYSRDDFVAEVERITGGEGAHVVYDSVGRSTFEGSLRCLRTRGVLALFGQSSGPVPAFDPRELATGSLFLTRPSLAHYTVDRSELEWRAGELFQWIAAGDLSLRIDRMLPLEQAAEAHRLLEGRATTGKVLLIP
ncbi:MAG TPA: quinone oxidoreductase [Gammaproteobacteria bacterium]|nr:quinone oxidoreductase [Gammaproteobacteria bacterium]